MRRSILVAAVCCLSASSVFGQEYVDYQNYGTQDVGMPGVMYSGSIGAGYGGQLYPYDRQDPWLHGHFQRMPAYGGFRSFRPYNYRHVLAQTQIATSVWGAPHGMPYSQQFWNRYRTDYLNGNVHSQASNAPLTSSVNPVNYEVPASGRKVPATATARRPKAEARPIHVYPAGVPHR